MRSQSSIHEATVLLSKYVLGFLAVMMKIIWMLYFTLFVDWLKKYLCLFPPFYNKKGNILQQQISFKWKEKTSLLIKPYSQLHFIIFPFLFNFIFIVSCCFHLTFIEMKFHLKIAIKQASSVGRREKFEIISSYAEPLIISAGSVKREMTISVAANRSRSLFKAQCGGITGSHYWGNDNPL